MATAVPNKESLLKLLSTHREGIKSYGVKQLSLFGSFVRNTAIHNDSDVDLLVAFEKDKKTFDNFMELSFYLEDILGRKVELVTMESLSKYLRINLLKQVEDVGL